MGAAIGALLGAFVEAVGLAFLDLFLSLFQVFGS